MNQLYKFNEIINSSLVKETIKLLFKKQNTEILERPASFIIKLKNEPEDKIFRIILLPPRGFTSNEIDRLSPHPEAKIAKIEIKGGIKLDKKGFSLLKNVIKYQYYTTRNIKITGDEPYPKINGKYYQEKIISSKGKFFVTKENGVGFYHNLVNLSDEWVLSILEKELRLQKVPNLNKALKPLAKNEQKNFQSFYKKVLLYGDKIFQNDSQLVNNVCNFDVAKIIPPLIELLNVLESGKHEACTIFAIILKIGKNDNRVIKVSPLSRQ
ncbi:MAG: hypothetical protein WCT26_03695 [Candidatus Buchananbacteria bacterium]